MRLLELSTKMNAKSEAIDIVSSILSLLKYNQGLIAEPEVDPEPSSHDESSQS